MSLKTRSSLNKTHFKNEKRWIDFENCVLSKKTNKIKYMMKDMSRSTKCDRLGNSFLHHLAKIDRADIVEYLIKEGCDVNAKNHSGYSPITIAVLHKNMQVAKALLAAGADHNGIVLYKTDLSEEHVIDKMVFFADDNLTLLHLAVIHGNCANNIEFVKALIEVGAHVNEKSAYGRIPLHYACSVGSIKLVKLLLKAGANINEICNAELTPLHYAALKINVNMVKILLEAGADINHVNVVGQTCLDFAAFIHSSDMMKLLLDHGADIHDSMPWCLESTEFIKFYRHENNQMACVELLLNNGADVDFTKVSRDALRCIAHDVMDLIFTYCGVSMIDFIDPNHVFYIGVHKICIIKHVAKIDALNKTGRPRNFDLNLLNDSEKNYYEQCRAELKTMTKPIWSQGTITYLDLLDNDKNGFMRNNSVKCAIKHKFIEKRFPIYATAILVSFSLKKNKQKLVERAALKFNSVVNTFNLSVRLEPNIIDNIFRLLKNKDLSNLAKI